MKPSNYYPINPCKYCGGPAESFRYRPDSKTDSYRVWCPFCHCQGPAVVRHRHDAIDGWNEMHPKKEE